MGGHKKVIPDNYMSGGILFFVSWEREEGFTDINLYSIEVGVCLSCQTFAVSLTAPDTNVGGNILGFFFFLISKEKYNFLAAT